MAQNSGNYLVSKHLSGRLWGVQASDGVVLIGVPRCGFLEPWGGCKDPHLQETLMPSGTNGQAESPAHQHQGSWIWASDAVASIVGGLIYFVD